MSDYYDRDGSPMSDVLRWAKMSENPDYKRVAEDHAGGYYVSTVWLGLDHQFGDGPPLIFETMVFAEEADGQVNYADLDCDRYSTETQALEGHRRMVERWSAETVTPPE